MPHASGHSGGRDPSGGARRRLFSRGGSAPPPLDPGLESEVRSAHHAILARFERGLSDIEANARSVLREAAEDAWQGTEEELKTLREQITRDLSRDQAIRGLIAHADERYQSLDVRVGRIEENLSNVERAATALTDALGEAATGDHRPEAMALGAVETRLAAVETGLAAVRETSRRVEETIEGVELASRTLAEAVTTAAATSGPDGPDLARFDERLATMEAGLDRVRETSRRIDANLEQIERAARSMTEALAAVGSAEGTSDALGIAVLSNRLQAVEVGLDGVRQSARRLQEVLDLSLGGMNAQIAELAVRLEPGPLEDGQQGRMEVDLRPVADRLSAVQDYLEQVVDYLSARDQALVEWIQGVAEHTDGVVVAEGARVEERLTTRLDLAALEAEGRLREAVEDHLGAIHERLQQHAQLLGEALSVVESKTMSRLQDQDLRLQEHGLRLEDVRDQVEGVRAAAVESAERVSVALHERMADLADQMRAESEDMRVRLVAKARDAGADASRDIDERLGRLSELVQAALGWSVDEIDRRIHQEILRAVSVGMADFVAAMDRRFVDLTASMDEGFTFLSRDLDGSIERAQQRVDEHLERTDRTVQAGMGALEESITERAAQAFDEVLEARLSPATMELGRQIDWSRVKLEETVMRTVGERADATGRLIEERAQHAARLIEERTTAISHQLAAQGETTAQLIEERAEATSRLIEERTEAAARGLQEAVTRALGERMASVAQLIRSDNMAIAERLAVIEEQAAAKEAIRAIKELAAAMPQEISEAIDERLAILAELFRRENKHTVDTVARAATALADRLDRTAVVIGDRFDRDVEVVVDQIGSTMQTLASGLSRASNRTARQ
ncbi:MAG: hypothetical protein ACJ77A_03755 [Actinomycetota bacterium]